MLPVFLANNSNEVMAVQLFKIEDKRETTFCTISSTNDVGFNAVRYDRNEAIHVPQASCVVYRVQDAIASIAPGASVGLCYGFNQ